MAAPAAAGTISDYGTYRINNHPDGGAAAPFYGLRLDGLLDGDQNKTFTFDFDDTANGAAMFLTYSNSGSGNELRIFGNAWGGRDVGSTYQDPQLWAIDFTYVSVTNATGDDDLWIASGATPGGGTIRAADLSGPITELKAFAGNHPYYFRLGDEDDDSGHRMTGGITGWGWMNHATPGAGTSLDTHLYSSDWLFTVNPVAVPLPPSAWMGVGLLGALGLVRLRRRRAPAI